MINRFQILKSEGNEKRGTGDRKFQRQAQLSVLFFPSPSRSISKSNIGPFEIAFAAAGHFISDGKCMQSGNNPSSSSPPPFSDHRRRQRSFEKGGRKEEGGENAISDGRRKEGPLCIFHQRMIENLNKFGRPALLLQSRCPGLRNKKQLSWWLTVVTPFLPSFLRIIIWPVAKRKRRRGKLIHKESI